MKGTRALKALEKLDTLALKVLRHLETWGANVPYLAESVLLNNIFFPGQEKKLTGIPSDVFLRSMGRDLVGIRHHDNRRVGIKFLLF